MFRKIVVAHNESPEAERALAAAIQLAKGLSAELHQVIVMTGLPAYTAFAHAADPSVRQILEGDRVRFHELLQENGRAQALQNGVEIHSHLVEGHEVNSIVDVLRKHQADLLVIGIHRRELHISRMWSTVYELAQEAPCSVLGVH